MMTWQEIEADAARGGSNCYKSTTPSIPSSQTSESLHLFCPIKKNHMVVPQWLNIMYSTVFFKACMAHSEVKRNNLNHFCIDCRQPMCLNCLTQHMFHNHIRRYIYSDVINRQDLCKLFNCSGIQTYHTNKAKVIFLKQRHRSQQRTNNKSRLYMFAICHKSLQENTLYCSIACKVIAIHGNECQRKASCRSHNFEDSDENKGGERTLQVPDSKWLKSRRKGVPQSAPMF